MYDLYWSVMSLGGYNKVSKWKDVGNDMMWRKLQCLVSKAPGKNYGLIRNQWDRWNLSKYEEIHGSKPLVSNGEDESVEMDTTDHRILTYTTPLPLDPYIPYTNIDVAVSCVHRDQTQRQ